MPRVWSALTGALERTVESPTHYWAVMGVDVFCAVAFVAIGTWTAAASALILVPTFAIGFMGWGLLEYALHRWILHGRPAVARHGHARHHAVSKALLATPIFVIAAAAWVLWALLSALVPPGIAAVAVGGTYSGYVYYSVLHHLLHHHAWMMTRSPYLQRMNRRHHVHHANPRANFGVSTAMWDHLFGTAALGRERTVRQSFSSTIRS